MRWPGAKASRAKVDGPLEVLGGALQTNRVRAGGAACDAREVDACATVAGNRRVAQFVLQHPTAGAGGCGVRAWG